MGQDVDSGCIGCLKSSVPASVPDQPVGFYRLRVSSDVCDYLANTWTSNADPELPSKAIFSQGGRRSEVRCGSVSQLPAWIPALRIKDRRRNEVAGGRSNAGLATQEI